MLSTSGCTITTVSEHRNPQRDIAVTVLKGGRTTGFDLKEVPARGPSAGNQKTRPMCDMHHDSASGAVLAERGSRNDGDETTSATWQWKDVSGEARHVRNGHRDLHGSNSRDWYLRSEKAHNGVLEQHDGYSETSGEHRFIQAAFVQCSVPVAIEQQSAPNSAHQSCDLLEFLDKATPRLQVPSGQSFSDLTLADVWGTMRDASLFGLEVPTCGSVLGRSSAYFVPLLSAMKLFTQGPNKKDRYSTSWRERATTSKCRYKGSERDWPADMGLLAVHHAQHLPWERMPLYHELHNMASQAPSDLVPDPQKLLSTPLHCIHPSSWICVWWQPLYRIPDMPLDAKFLVYYSFESVWNPPPPPYAISFQLEISGLLTGGVEVQSSVAAANSGERWLHIPRNGDEDPDITSQQNMLQGKLQELLAHFHSRAQQLTCSCDHSIEIIARDGLAHEDEGHKDFNFLQRGRLGYVQA